MFGLLQKMNLVVVSETVKSPTKSLLEKAENMIIVYQVAPRCFIYVWSTLSSSG